MIGTSFRLKGRVFAKYSRYRIAHKTAKQLMISFSPAVGLSKKEQPVINIITLKKEIDKKLSNFSLKCKNI